MKFLFALFSARKKDLSLTTFTGVILSASDLINIRGGGANDGLDGRDEALVLLVDDN